MTAPPQHASPLVNMETVLMNMELWFTAECEGVKLQTALAIAISIVGGTYYRIPVVVSWLPNINY